MVHFSGLGRINLRSARFLGQFVLVVRDTDHLDLVGIDFSKLPVNHRGKVGVSRPQRPQDLPDRLEILGLVERFIRIPPLGSGRER